MEQSTFFRGLLYGLRSAGREKFRAGGSEFHRAFKETLLYAKTLDVDMDVDVILEDYDPVFNVYYDANAMLLEAERDFIISLLNPRLREASFEIDEDVARRELRELPDPGKFEELGKRFHEQLGG